MSLIVAKFGGTSVASPERIQMVAKKLIAKKQAGHQVVAVVSAMGKTTDELVGLAASLNDNPPAREMDRLLSTGEQVSMTLLAMAIEARVYQAMSFTGRQAGIETDGTHAKAKIVKVHNERIMEALNKGVIAVVAGFQGIDANGDITTLGRGGSDTTAVAVASSRTTTCWSCPAPAPACCRCAPWSSRASTRSSFIPARRSPTRRAPISRRRPT